MFIIALTAVVLTGAISGLLALVVTQLRQRNVSSEQEEAPAVSEKARIGQQLISMIAAAYDTGSCGTASADHDTTMHFNFCQHRRARKFPLAIDCLL